MMEPHLFWKNFRLGTELQISGSFIYNGLEVLDRMNTFYYEHECFEFLYNISVGIERLQKIAVILLEHDETKSQEDFEKSLILHSKHELLRRIKKKTAIKVSKQQNKFLTLLDNFYISARYDRYNLASVYKKIQDKDSLVAFLSEELKLEIKTEMFMPTMIEPRVRRFVGKLVGKLTTQLYDMIHTQAARLNIYTYEIAVNTKAFKIFIAKQFDFERERLMQREVCLYLLKNLPDDGMKKFINSAEPLEFGQLATSQYFQSMFDYHGDSQVLDEMEYLYEENEIKRTRVDEVMLLGADVNFDGEDEDEDPW